LSRTDAFLRQHWLLENVQENEAAQAVAAISHAAFHEGDVLVRQGDPSDGVYLIADGTVRISAASQTGQTFLSVVRPGELLGELGVLDGEPRSATATAMSDGEAYFVPTDTFLHLLDISSAASRHLMLLLATRLRQTNERMMQLPPPRPVQRRTMPIRP